MSDVTDVRDEDAAGNRVSAYERLWRIEAEGSYVGLESFDAGVGGRERRQILEYVAGVTRWKRRLDSILAQYYRGDYGGMELGLKIVLRIGLYDILYLSTPPYAAVNEAVTLAKRVVRRGAGGLVNGVLRSILRELDRLPEPSTGDAANDLAIRHSHPTWFVRRWIARYGQEGAEALLQWNNARPVYGVRINTLKISSPDFEERLRAAGAEWEPGALKGFVRMSSVQPLLEHGLLREGLCAVQDESAGFVVALLDPRPGERVVDLCAAPGGKALYAAERMENRGEIAAVDVHEGRLRMVSRAVEAQGAGVVHPVVADARAFDGTWTASADRVLVDAPCSGLGVLAKRADLRWRRSPEDLVELARLQDEILDAAAELVRPGGVLVYGTCTIEPEENEQRVHAFLKRRQDFRLEDAREYIPERLVTEDGFYATFPPRDRMDGAFAARMVRTADAAGLSESQGSSSTSF